MIDIRIIPPPDLQRLIDIVSRIPGGLERAATRAVRRTLRGGKQDAARKIAQRYTIKAGVVIGTIRITQSGVSGEMSSRGRVNPLKLFKIRPRSRPKKPLAGGVYVQNVKGAGGYIRRGFLTRSGNVVSRTGISRYPLRGHAGPSSPGMLSKVGDEVSDKMFQRLEINLNHELSAILGGFG